MIKACFDIVDKDDIRVLAGASKKAQGADCRDKHGGKKRILWRKKSQTYVVSNCFVSVLIHVLSADRTKTNFDVIFVVFLTCVFFLAT